MVNTDALAPDEEELRSLTELLLDASRFRRCPASE
jgi:hypothetical protein